MTPSEIKQRAFDLVKEASNYGEMWDVISAETLQMLVDAVAGDLGHQAEPAETLAPLNRSRHDPQQS